jgi:rare lipoprotein A
MIIMLIALGMMLGIRIERQQHAQAANRDPTAGLAADKKAVLPAVPLSEAKKISEAPEEAVAPKKKEDVVKASTRPEPVSESAKAQPEPTATPVKNEPEVALKKSETQDTAATVKKTTASVSEKAARPGHYAVQVEATQDENKASSRVEILKNKGLIAYIDEVYLEGKGRYYRVMVGPFQTKAEAQKSRDTLKKDSRFKESFIKYIP